MRRDLDSLGYYSQALEAAKTWNQKKGTPEQALMWLKKSGVKDAEIEATGLRAFLDGKKSVTREEVVAHLEGSRVRLRKVDYSRSANPKEEIEAHIQDEINGGAIQREGSNEWYYGGRVFDTWENAEAALRNEALSFAPSDTTKWSAYSLDPSNPTYRETVLHLP